MIGEERPHRFHRFRADRRARVEIEVDPMAHGLTSFLEKNNQTAFMVERS